MYPYVIFSILFFLINSNFYVDFYIKKTVKRILTFYVQVKRAIEMNFMESELKEL